MFVYMFANIHVIWQLLQLGFRISIYITLCSRDKNIHLNILVKEKVYKVES